MLLMRDLSQWSVAMNPLNSVKLLTEVLEHLNLDISMCIGNSIDEAPNMQGQYRGFSALLASQSPNHVHVFCYSHVLNVVLSETTQMID